MVVSARMLADPAATSLCASGNFHLGFDSGRIGLPMKHQLGNFTLECVQGDIVEQTDLRSGDQCSQCRTDIRRWGLPGRFIVPRGRAWRLNAARWHP